MDERVARFVEAAGMSTDGKALFLEVWIVAKSLEVDGTVNDPRSQYLLRRAGLEPPYSRGLAEAFMFAAALMNTSKDES